MQMIQPVKPRSDYRHYSNPKCQGSLMRQTAKWPVAPYRPVRIFIKSHGFFSCVNFSFVNKDGEWDDEVVELEEEKPVPVPKGLKYGAAYADRMWEWDAAKMERCRKLLSHGFDSSDDELIRFATEYFDKKVVAVRTTYYYNVATGYDCPVMEYLYSE